MVKISKRIKMDAIFILSACGSDFSILFCDQAFFSFSGALKTADGQRKRKEGPPDHGYISYGDRKMVLKATIPDTNSSSF